MRFHLGDGFVFQEGEPDTIAISEDVLQTLNLHIVPELKQFVAYQDGKLIIPASMMMTLTRISHAENVDYHLIIGHQGVKRYLDKDHYEDKVDDPKTTKNESKSDSDGADIEVIKSFDEFTNHKGDPAEFEKYAVQWTARKIDQRTLDQKVQDLPSVKSLQLTDNDTKLTITTLGENPPGQTITIDVPTDGLIGKKLLITVKTDGSQEVKLEPGVDGATTFEVEYRKIGSHTGEVITDLDTDIANVSNSINQFIVPEKIAEFHYLPDTNDIKKAFDVAAVK
ncbi:MAG: hypothetical protein H6766_04895 [Candidatus Peribacteria bacterium]|nr:MAG: hypothetical protein H6766_04895 [Candidatus Peribacteria bacterium]